MSVKSHYLVIAALDFAAEAAGDRRPPLLQTGIVLRIDRLVALVVVPVGAGMVPLTVGCWKGDLVLLFKELNAETHRDMESNVTVHQPGSGVISWKSAIGVKFNDAQMQELRTHAITSQPPAGINTTSRRGGFVNLSCPTLAEEKVPVPVPSRYESCP
jgi:hypothetical protein